jgi:L-lactate utilization protein LutB
MVDDYHGWLNTKLGERCVKNLKSHGFDACFVADADEARDLILQLTADFVSFGFGGSDTTRSLGLIEMLVKQGKEVFDHLAEGFDLATSLENRKAQMRSDCFFCSANALSMTGEIVNVDGVGNRTNAMSFGPKKVIVVAGINKVTPDLNSALARVQQVAGPMRAKSLGMPTPCAETGICNDCNVPQRICRITTILHRKPMLTDMSVVLVNKNMGY